MPPSTSGRLDTTTATTTNNNNIPDYPLTRGTDWLPKSPDGAYTGEKVPFPPSSRWSLVLSPFDRSRATESSSPSSLSTSSSSTTVIVILIFLSVVLALVCWHHRLAVELASEQYHKVTGQELKETELFKALEEKMQKIRWKSNEL